MCKTFVSVAHESQSYWDNVLDCLGRSIRFCVRLLCQLPMKVRDIGIMFLIVWEEVLVLFGDCLFVGC